MIPLPSLVVTLLLRNHMPYRSYKSQRANSARSEITDAETDGMSRGPTQNVSARQGPKHNFHTPQKAKAPGAHAREDRCQNRPHVQRTNTTCSLGKNRCTPSNVFARQEPMHNFQCSHSARTDAHFPMRLLGKNRCTTSNAFAWQEPMHNFQYVRSVRTDAQLPYASKGKYARHACSGRPMPKQTRRPEDQHNVFARQEPKHNFHQPQRTNTMCSLGKNRSTTSISLRGQMR